MRLSELTWPKAEEYFARHDAVLLSIGSVECHGRHMPLGTDTLIPEHLLGLIEPKTDVLIAPTLPFGACDYLSEYPGTINLGEDLLYRLFSRVCDEFYRHGARHFVVLNGHGGGEETAAILDIDPALVDRSEIGPELKFSHLTDKLETTGFSSVRYKGVTVEIPRLTDSVTDSGWIGPDHPRTATAEWGREMLSATADYIAEFMEEFKKAPLGR